MNLLSLEDEKLKKVEVNGYKFTIRFISPRDRILISQRRVSLNPAPIECLTEFEFMYSENIAIVDICVEEMPKEFKDYESSKYWIDEDLILGVSEEIKKHTNEQRLFRAD